MIQGIIVLNNNGCPRLTKFYNLMSYEKQREAIREAFQLVTSRADTLCNFVENSKVWGKGIRLIYRHYATLYFIFAVDESESELGILDLVQVLVEALDKSFENVCELDLIFHADKVHYIVDEIVMGGMVLETNLKEIVKAVKESARHEHKTQDLMHRRRGSQIQLGAGK